MPDHVSYYPPSPKNVPPGLTRTTAAYRRRVFLVLASLFLFTVVYLGLTVGSAYLSYWCFTRLGEQPTTKAVPTTDARGRPAVRYVTVGDKPNPVVLIPAGLGSALLCVFLVKGLFKRRPKTDAFRIEVTEGEQPTLFAFIRLLCADTKAPFPRRVYLVPDVTAAVAFEESLRNLIFPSEKNLIIGLGLVNGLTLTEFKAVLAHEFGHFSQQGMRLGSYVYTANRVIAEVVYGRDWLDDAVAAAGRIDIRLSIFVWTFAGGLWVVRKGLHYLFRGMTFARSALSRQMEFNADLVAVSVTGSDPLVFALAKLDFAADSLGSAWGDLMAAADHGRYTRDVYHHQTTAAEHLRAKRGDATLGRTPALPDDPAETVRVFRPSDTSVPMMWATHPSNADREANAKARYFRGPEDDRSPWVLFRDPADVRRRMTAAAYAANRKEAIRELEAPDVIQAFLDAEHAETTHPPKYHGLYENRYLNPGDPRDLTTSAKLDYADPSALAAAHAGLLDDLKPRMDEHRQRQEEGQRLTGIADGFVALTGRDFEFRGRRYTQPDADRLRKKVEKEIAADFAWMHWHDRLAFGVHSVMAWQLAGSVLEELAVRYEFHLAAQEVHKWVTGAANHVRFTLGALQGQRQVPPEEFQQAVAVLREAAEIMKAQLDTADKLHTPPLTNLPVGTKLGGYLYEGDLVRPISRDAGTIDGKWVHALLTQADTIAERAARILFKSLGAILALQDRVAADWHARRADGTLLPDGDHPFATDALPLAPDLPPEPTPPVTDKPPRNRPKRPG